MNKKFYILIGLVFTFAATFLIVNLASAATRQENKDQMVQDLAKKLNISEEKVSSALDEIRSQRQEERKEEINSSLSKAVSDKVITEEQKQKMISRMEENRNLNKNGSSQKGQNRESMQQWFNDNGIDENKLREYLPVGKNGNQRHGNCIND